jgi:hypothetical protein
MQWKEITLEETAKVKGFVPATLHYHEDKVVYLTMVDESPPPDSIQEAAKAYVINRENKGIGCPVPDKVVYDAFVSGASHLSGEVERLKREAEDRELTIKRLRGHIAVLKEELDKYKGIAEALTDAGSKLVAAQQENERLKGIAAGFAEWTSDKHWEYKRHSKVWQHRTYTGDVKTTGVLLTDYLSQSPSGLSQEEMWDEVVKIFLTDYYSNPKSVLQQHYLLIKIKP